MSAIHQHGGTAQDKGYAWVVLAASFTLCIFKGGQFGNLGYFLVKFLTHYEISNSEASTIGALNLFLGNFLALIAGIIIKRHGCRKTTMWSSLVVTVSYILPAFIDSLIVVYIFFGAVSGIGFLGMHLCAMTASQQHFNKHRSFATSLCATGTGIGVLVWPTLTYLLDTHYGWRGALLIEGAIFLNGMVCGALLRNFHEPETENTQSFSLKMLCPFIGFCTKGHAEKKGNRYTFLPFYIFLLGIFFIYLGHITMLVYTPLRTKRIGYTDEQGALLVSLIGFLALIRFIFGWIGDKKLINRASLLGVTSIFGGVLMISITFTKSYIQLAILQGAFGFASAGYMALQAVVLVDTVGIKNVVMANSAYIIVCGISNLVTNVATGALLDITGDVDMPFWLFGGAEILAGICFLIIPELQKYVRKHDLEENS